MNSALRRSLLMTTVGAVLTAPRVAHAYIDPGSAGFILVSILSFLAAIGYAAQNHMTVLDAVHALLRCLSGGESALAQPRDRTIFFGPAEGQDLSIFEEYLYE